MASQYREVVNKLKQRIRRSPSELRMQYALEILMIAYVDLFESASDNLEKNLELHYFEVFNIAYESVMASEVGTVHDLDELYERALMLSIPIRKLGHVYVLRREDGLYKIGCTIHLEKRIRDLEREHGKLERTYAFQCEDHYRAEQTLHERYKRKRVEGEWFSLSERDINEIIRTHKLISGVESRIIKADF